MPDLTPTTLRAWRDARGLSAREAAVVLGLSVRTLEGLEQGRSPGSPLWGVLGKLLTLLAT